MSYLDDILVLNPSIHWTCGDAGSDVLDFSGNNFDAVMLSLSGTQYVRQVESLVRNSPLESINRATLLNTSLSATSGVGRIHKASGVGTVNLSNSYTLIIWFRWKVNTASLMYFDLDASGSTGALEILMFDSNSIRLSHINAGHLGGSQNLTINIGNTVRVDSRHMLVVSYDFATTIASIYVDGVLKGSGSIVKIHSSYIIEQILVGDTLLAPQRPLRHYVQHISTFGGIALTPTQINDLWLSGRNRPGRDDTYVDFSEIQYSDGVSVVGTSRWSKYLNTGFTSYGVVEDSVGSIFGGRILDIRTGANSAAIVWNEAFREPQQRFLTRARVTAGSNLCFGIILLAGWDHTSNTSFTTATAVITGIEFRVFGNQLQIRQKIGTATTTLATFSFNRSAGDWFNLKGEVDSFTLEIRAKIWADEDPEPDDWSIDIFTMDTAFQYGDGNVVLHCDIANTFIEVDMINLAYNSGPPLGVPVINAIATDVNDITVTTITPGFNATTHNLYRSNTSPVLISAENLVGSDLGAIPSPYVDAGLSPGIYYYRLVAILDEQTELSNTVLVILQPEPEINACTVVDPVIVPDSYPEDTPQLLGEGCGIEVLPPISTPIQEDVGIIVQFDPCS